jgi:hypothetical protein
MGTYNTIVDLMGHRHLGEKTLLFLLDGLYVAVDQSTALNPQYKFKNPPFNGSWPCSIFSSQDGVALESVALDFMRSEAATFINVDGNVDNYLHEASKADNPPSGTVYCPDGAGTRLTSLGVHEHWNNATDRKYSRNLSTGGTGIELVSSRPSAVSVLRSSGLAASGLKLISYPSRTEILTTGAYARASVSIFNSRGLLVRRYSANSGTASTGSLVWNHRSIAPGLYTIRAICSAGQVSELAVLIQ